MDFAESKCRDNTLDQSMKMLKNLCTNSANIQGMIPQKKKLMFENISEVLEQILKKQLDKFLDYKEGYYQQPLMECFMRE